MLEGESEYLGLIETQETSPMPAISSLTICYIVYSLVQFF